MVLFLIITVLHIFNLFTFYQLSSQSVQIFLVHFDQYFAYFKLININILSRIIYIDLLVISSKVYPVNLCIFLIATNVLTITLKTTAWVTYEWFSSFNLFMTVFEQKAAIIICFSFGKFFSGLIAFVGIA